MKSPVYFSDLKTGSGKTLLDKVGILLERAHLESKIKEKDLVAIKLHFGEKGNTAFVRPIFLRRIVDEVRRCKGKPFLTDANTLYVGTRSETVSHIATARENGFDSSVVDAPVIIADGLRGGSAVKVRIDRPIFKTVSIAHDIHTADVLISVTHFKGHELCGFGGTLKNLGMGCASREGKLTQHSDISPKVTAKHCKGCELCLPRCPGQAISIVDLATRGGGLRRLARIDPQTCIGCGECILACPSEAIQVQWNNDIPLFQKKMVEYAYGVIEKKKGKILYLNFLTQISPYCDCNPNSGTPIVRDIGILSSEDPVAIEQASVDLVNAQMGNRDSKLPGNWEPGEDKFRALYPKVDWTVQLTYAEQLGMGTREYELIEI